MIGSAFNADTFNAGKIKTRLVLARAGLMSTC